MSRKYGLAMMCASLTSPAYSQSTLSNMELHCAISSSAMLPNQVVVGSVQSSNGQNATGTATLSSRATIAGVVRILIKDSEATMFIPNDFLPSFSKGKEGWFPVKALNINDTNISGKVQLNFMRASTFNVDRRTGAFSTSGGSQGTCERIDDIPKKF